MRTSFVLFVLAITFGASSQHPSKRSADEYVCKVRQGNKLIPNGGRSTRLDLPCKYAAVRQTCGDYRVVVSPGNVFVRNKYFMNTLYLQVTQISTGKRWDGRTSSKVAAKYINDATGTRRPLHKRLGRLVTDDLFDFSKSKDDVTAKAKDGSFSLSFGPYDPTGNKHRNVDFTFKCELNGNDKPNDFPQQICGGEDKDDVKEMAERLGIKTGKKFTSDMKDMTYYYAMFTDTEIDQSPSPKCGEVADTMMNVCQSDAQRVEAIDRCHKILNSNQHRECATQYTCDIIDVFADCVKFVCSNYTDQASCESVGETIDMCREFPGLSDKVSTCYNDLFIELDPNSDNKIRRPAP